MKTNSLVLNQHLFDKRNTPTQDETFVFKIDTDDYRFKSHTKYKRQETQKNEYP